jgi:hypothetical protein
MTLRVYVPTTMTGLRDVVQSDGVGPAPFLAHAVTDALRAELGDGGEEEWEYAAASAAALASVGLIHEAEPARRVVLAVDVPGARRVDVEDPTTVEVEEVVPFRWIAAVLADSVEAEAAVAAARTAEVEGSPDAAELLERCLDHELGWWATQEIGHLLEASA